MPDGDRGLREPAGVGADRHDVPALGHARLSIVGIIGENQSDHRHLTAFTENQSHRLLDLRRPNVEPSRQRHREVVRAEADHVDAIEAKDLVELIERASGLDLRTGNGPIVGGLEIIAIMIEPRPVRAPAAVPTRGVFHRPHEGLSILDVPDQRAHDSLGAGVQRAPDQPWIVFRDADDRRETASARRGEAAEQGLVAAQAMLLVDGDAVPARLADQLDEKGVVEGEPGVEQGAALSCRRAEAVLAHEAAHALPSASIWPAASPINSAILRLIWWSDWPTPLASKSPLILRKTSSSPGSTRSALITSRA